MGHDVGDSCDTVCDNCGVVFCTREIRICPVCGTVPWIFDGGARKKEFDDWFKDRLVEINREREAKRMEEEARVRGREYEAEQRKQETKRLASRKGV